MFIIVNRHREILYRDGQFYPAYAFVVASAARLFETEQKADGHRVTIREYTRTMPVEASL